jgi:hypothetical protein
MCIGKNKPKISTLGKLRGSLSFSLSPAAFTKTCLPLESFPIYGALRAVPTAYGTKTIAGSNNNIFTYVLCGKLESGNKYSIKNTAAQGRNQKIRFHKLSLVQRFFIAWSIIIFTKEFLLLIIAYFTRLSKKIVPGTLLILIFFCYASQTLASSVLHYNTREITGIIAKAEEEQGIPRGLLLAVCSAESSLRPYVLNNSGKAFYFDSQEGALLIAGNTNVDIGPAQLNYFWHGKNFISPEQMLDPKENINYAAAFLAKLHEKHGSWHKAVRFYHSSHPILARKYSRKITEFWMSDLSRKNSAGERDVR